MPRGKGLEPSASCGAPEASLSACQTTREAAPGWLAYGRPASADPLLVIRDMGTSN